MKYLDAIPEDIKLALKKLGLDLAIVAADKIPGYADECKFGSFDLQIKMVLRVGCSQAHTFLEKIRADIDKV